VRRRLSATYGLALSGIAGPTGGSTEKPVGTVFIAVAGPDRTEVRRLRWNRGRDEVRTLAATAVLQLLYRELAK
jgi:nicotinamide-nucleotide amidase